MLRAAVQLLACPMCGGDLIQRGTSLECRSRHTFDVARQGYASLLTGDTKADAGDTAAMVAAREDFLRGGHYDPLLHAVAARAGDAIEGVPGAIVDLGAGNGHYLAATLSRCDDRIGLALDISKFALRRAAPRHENIAGVACDAWRGLPLRDGSAALVLNVFAPRNGAEIARILTPGGSALVVTPTADHLAEILDPMGMLRVDERKDERLTQALSPHLDKDDEAVVTARMTLGHGELADLVAMGPTAFHRSPAQIADAVRRLPEPMTVTASVTLSRWLRRAADDAGYG